MVAKQASSEKCCTRLYTLLSSPSISSSSYQITQKFCMEVTYDEILTHAIIWNDGIIFDDDISILIFDLCH